MFCSSLSLTLLQATLFSSILSAAVAGLEHGTLVDTQAKIVTIGGHQVHVATVPIDSSSAFIPFGTTSPSTSLTKRVVTNNACQYGCSVSCINGLSSSPDPPLAADCAQLADALKALAQSEITNTYPCNSPYQPTCPNFVVPPGYERQYTIGTCLMGFINLFPAGGPSLSGCDYLLAGTLPGMFKQCVTNAGTTGAICAQTIESPAHFALEVRHT